MEGISSSIRGVTDEEPCPASSSDGSQGVLLYYKYVDVENAVFPEGEGREGLRSFVHENCRVLNLVGRVRVAKDGLNSTLGGRMADLRCHADAISALDGFGGIDFKLARSDGPLNRKVEEESGFDGLSVQLQDEVVTMGPRGAGISHALAAQHLSPEEFHHRLETADANGGKGKLLIIDVRNVYESRIGRFEAKGAQTLVPETRTFSQFPEWLDENEHKLKNRRVLMYCTGGVRCERASAYLRSKGPCFHDVCQLSGGIQRYLERYPGDEGFFHGKNFVFDSRSAVNGEGRAGKVCGRCMRCRVPHDDYGKRIRCSHCRLLLLICDACEPKIDDTQKYCEICRKAKRAKSSQSKAASPGGAGAGTRKLKLLCLHGFQQTAKSFRGRTAAIRKRMRTIDFVYIDAPYELPPLEEGAEPKRSWLKAHPLNRDNPEAFTSRLDPALGLDAARADADAFGWDATFSYLVRELRALGPFDGVLAFSQGAAVASLLCARLSSMGELSGAFKFVVLCSGYRPKLTPASSSSSEAPGTPNGESGAGTPSSYLDVPSLHVFGGSPGLDKHVPMRRSEELAEGFEPSTRVILRHDQGHVIPCGKTYCEGYARFMQPFIS